MYRHTRRWWLGILIVFGIGLLVVVAFFAALVIQNIRTGNLNLGGQTFINTNNVQIMGTATIESSDDPYVGAADAAVVIVEFSDFQCPYCLQAFPIVREIIQKYGNRIKFQYRDFPNVDSHPDALNAAEAAECSHEQGKFWEMHDKIFINQNNLSLAALKAYAEQIGLDMNQFNQCLDSEKYQAEIQQDFDDAVLAGATGTPTFFINNTKYAGVIPSEYFTLLIDRALGQ